MKNTTFRLTGATKCFPYKPVSQTLEFEVRPYDVRVTQIGSSFPIVVNLAELDESIKLPCGTTTVMTHEIARKVWTRLTDRGWKRDYSNPTSSNYGPDLVEYDS